MNLIWQNAQVNCVHAGPEDHGIPTISLRCEGDGWSQSFGGHALYDSRAWGNFVAGACAVVEVDRLQGAVGKLVRVGRRERWSTIVAIRPIVKDWPVFMPGDDLASDPGLYDLVRWIEKFGDEDEQLVAHLVSERIATQDRALDYARQLTAVEHRVTKLLVEREKMIFWLIKMWHHHGGTSSRLPVGAQISPPGFLDFLTGLGYPPWSDRAEDMLAMGVPGEKEKA